MVPFYLFFSKTRFLKKNSKKILEFFFFCNFSKKIQKKSTLTCYQAVLKKNSSFLAIFECTKIWGGGGVRKALARNEPKFGLRGGLKLQVFGREALENGAVLENFCGKSSAKCGNCLKLLKIAKNYNITHK